MTHHTITQALPQSFFKLHIKLYMQIVNFLK